MMCATTQHYWRHRTLPFLELRSTYRSLQSYKPHFHPQLSFGAVTEGRTRANCGGREFLLGQGDLVLIAPHVVHSCNPIERQPRSYQMLYLDEAWCLENLSPLHGRSLLNVGVGSIVIRSDELFGRYLELLAGLADMRPPEAAAQLQRLLTDAIGSNCHTATLLPQPLDLGVRIKQVLLDNIESPLTLNELARAFGCRKETLIRVFKRAFHTTPQAFLNNARVEKAKQRLKLGQEIAHVAADLGFSDQAQLHRTFVNYTASTPGQYRRAGQGATRNFRQ
jgi:AraC-like DNA-binding protein